MWSYILNILLLFVLVSCGKNVLPKQATKGNSFPGNNNTPLISYNPVAPSISPVILSLFYYDNGTAVEWEYPLGQIANYRVEFCSDHTFTACSKVIQVSCSETNHCSKSSGSTGIITVGDGWTPGRMAILYSYQPTGQTFSIRVRAESATGVSAWMFTSHCTFSIPAQCFAY